MAAIRSLLSIVEKWARVTPERAPEYKAGIEAPKKDWAKNALEAKETWKSAITAAAARDAYGKGVQQAGSEKWKRGALQKGTGRYAEGVQIAQPDYQKGFSKYHSIIEKTTLPPRYPKGDPRNLERVKTISQALRQAKISE
jgi:hypothetical protein